MKKFIKITFLACVLLIAGCPTAQQKPSEYLKKDIASVTKVIDTSATDISTSVQRIDDSVINIKQDTNAAKVEAVGTKAIPLLNNIEKNANNIAKESQKLKETSLKLSQAGVKSDISERSVDSYVKRAEDAEKTNEDLTGKITKLEENARAGLNRMLKWIIGACVVGAGVCAAVAIFFGNIKGGLTGAAACIVIMTLAIAVSQYMMYIAIAGGVIVIGTLGILGYQLLMQRRAITDNVWTQEVVKKHLPLDIKEKIYGSKNEKGHAGFIQSATTQKMIKNIKKKLPRGWQLLKNDNDIST
jgi:hypothetical protein